MLFLWKYFTLTQARDGTRRRRTKSGEHRCHVEKKEMHQADQAQIVKILGKNINIELEVGAYMQYWG